MKRVLIFLLGIIIGTGTGLLIGSGILAENHYFVLEEDCVISNVGTLKKGVTIKYDAGMSEGLTRYILYLNAKDTLVEPYQTEKHLNLIIPYWLYSAGQHSTNNHDSMSIR